MPDYEYTAPRELRIKETFYGKVPREITAPDAKIVKRYSEESAKLRPGETLRLCRDHPQGARLMVSTADRVIKL
jgi:hypothetical protein